MERADKGEEEYRELNRGISHDCCCCCKRQKMREESSWRVGNQSALVLLYSTPLLFFFGTPLLVGW